MSNKPDISADSDTRYYGIFNDSFPPIIDGVTLTVQNYAEWLARMGKKPCVVTPWNPSRYEAGYKVMRYFSLPILNRHPYRYGYPKADPFIWRSLMRVPFRLVHSHCPFSSGRLAVYVARKQRVPLIGTFHSKYRSDLEHSFRHTPWMVDIIMKRILNFFNACDQVWIPQGDVEKTIREYGYKGKVTVVENGNDFPAPDAEALHELKRSARHRLGWTDDSLSLIFVGQHIWEKGIGLIAESLEAIGGKIPFRMNFIGKGYALESLRTKVAEAGLSDRVMIHGEINDRNLLADYYAASDIFLFPSMYDNAPLVVREAAAMGTPAILLRGSTAAEIITDGINGFIADNSPASYADLILRLDSDRAKIAQVGRNAAATLFRSWDDVMCEVMDRYESIIKNFRR